MFRSGDSCVHDDDNDNNDDNDDRTDHFTPAHVCGVISGINYHPWHAVKVAMGSMLSSTQD